jgi:hypothetical protein
MLKSLVHGSLRRLGLSILRGDARAELDDLRRELAVCRQEIALRQQQVHAYQQSVLTGGCFTDDASLPEPTPKHRLGDDPILLRLVQEAVQKAQLPAAVSRILTDPQFSIEDRSKYMKLFPVGPPELYTGIAPVIAMIINRQYIQYQPRHPNQELMRRQAETLRSEGILPLGRVFDDRQVREIQDYFLKRPIFNGHVPMSAKHRLIRRYVNYTAEQFPLGSYSVQEIALAPHLLEFVLSPMILDTAAAYFGCAPRLSWLQSWWNFAGPGDYPHRQHFYHRDTNDFGMFWVYIYLTDVDAGSGPHSLIRRSGDYAVLRERFERAKSDPALAGRLANTTLDELNGTGHTVSDELKELVFDGLVETIGGPAGTVFITRGVDLHKVVTPLVRKRQIYAARFCINELNYYGWDRDGDPVPAEVVAERVGEDEQLRYITGNRFDWSHWANS